MKAKRTSLPQGQTTTNPRQADNSPGTRNQSSTLQNDNREMTCAEAVANPNKQHNVQEKISNRPWSSY